MWRPEPMSAMDFPFDHERFAVETPDGPQNHDARTLGTYCAVPIVGNLELLAVMVADAVFKVGDTIDREMTAAGRVADTHDWELMLTVRARVKTWPAVPGITIPAADPDYCPRCGEPNHETGGNFEYCSSCTAGQKPMPGESS